MSASITDIFKEFKSAKIRTGQTSRTSFEEIGRFLRFLGQNGEQYLTYKTCLQYLEMRREKLCDYSLQECYQILRHFSRWAHLVNNNNESLPRRKRRLNGRRTPIILNDEKVSRIIAKMRKTCVQRPLSALAYSTLIGLLYVTGMRISEALINLSDADVNLEENYIYVREGKAARDRYIPITASTSKMLAAYRKAREKRFPSRRDRFFLIHTGAVNSPQSFRLIFARVTSQLGFRSIDQQGYESTALVPHDLRHSYATNTLIKFHRENLNIDEELPKLSMVLGHESIKETYWYIEAVPELLATIIKRRTKNAR